MKSFGFSFFKRSLGIILALLSVLLLPLTLVGCRNNLHNLKIGVLREDDTSGEATAWEAYLKEMSKEYGFTIDFTTTNSSSSEVAAINTYASKGYRAILLFSDDDRIASINAAASKKMYVVCPTGHPTEAEQKELRGIEYYLGSVAPTPDDEYLAGYRMAEYFAGEKGQRKFTLFGGATSYGSEMHIQRLCGILAYLCTDEGTSYDGAKTREELIRKVAGTGVNPALFRSGKYSIVGYMDGFGFDDAFSAKLTNSIAAGGNCILSVGAGEVVTRIAYGITSADQKLGACTVGGVDAITTSYASAFDLGYSYDCGKYASSMAPALVMVLCAVKGEKILDEDGYAPAIGTEYWVATSRANLEQMLAADNAETGYCFNRAVIDHYVAQASLSSLTELCKATFEEAVQIHARYNSPVSEAMEG